jgi:hypothetical protein
MRIEIGDVQHVTIAGDIGGWGFTLKDSIARPARFATITYSTRDEAEAAREQILAATKDAIDLCVQA